MGTEKARLPIGDSLKDDIVGTIEWLFIVFSQNKMCWQIREISMNFAEQTRLRSGKQQ